MIKSSTMNFVRQKAQEGADFAALHEHLKAIASIDVEGEKKKLAKVVADKAKAEADLKAAQQAALVRVHAADTITAEAKRLKAEAEDIVAKAVGRAKDIVTDAYNRGKDEAEKWGISIEAHKQQLVSVQADLAKADADLESKQKAHAELEKSHAELLRRRDQMAATLAGLK